MTRQARSILDISTPVRAGMAVYPGDPAVQLERVATASAADPSSTTVERLSASTHTGTHVDAPAHVVPGGATVDELPLELLCGPARVLDLEGAGSPITVDALRRCGLDARVERLLVRTRGPATGPGLAYDLDHAHLAADAAAFLRASTAVRLLGVDAPSVDSSRASTLEVHRLLLAAEPPIVVVEGLELGHVRPGDYELVCLPLRLAGAGGAPARAALVTRRAARRR